MRRQLAVHCVRLGLTNPSLSTPQYSLRTEPAPTPVCVGTTLELSNGGRASNLGEVYDED